MDLIEMANEVAALVNDSNVRALGNEISVVSIGYDRDAHKNLGVLLDRVEDAIRAIRKTNGLNVGYCMRHAVGEMKSRKLGGVVSRYVSTFSLCQRDGN